MLQVGTNLAIGVKIFVQNGKRPALSSSGEY